MELFSAEDLTTIQVVVNVALGGSVCFIGISFNIVSIIVFLKQGLRQTVNISLLAIAISDLCSLLALVWVDINYNPFMESADIPYEPYDILYITGARPHVCFLQITICITMYVTAERFVCIALPLKVKQIFTPLRAKVVISLIYLLTFLAILPSFMYFDIGGTFNPARNVTRVGLKLRGINQDFTMLVSVMFVGGQVIEFVILTMVTCLLVVALKQKLKWRKTVTANRNQHRQKPLTGVRAMKMVGLVAGALIACTAPGIMLSLAEIILDEFRPAEKCNTTFQGLWSFIFITEAITATVNSVFYYRMSSKYKQHVHDLLSRCTTCCHGSCVKN